MFCIRRMSVVVILMGLLASPVSYAAPDNGEVRQQGGQQRAWHAASSQWLALADFWLRYTQTAGGITWGHSSDYPPYEKVQEHDTFLVMTAQGDCLMEFFHSRWRRANDVRRWHDAFNEYAGCPYVFD